MKARSVPFWRRTRYCSGVSSARHWASVCAAGEVVVVVGVVSVSLMTTTIRRLRVGSMTARRRDRAPLSARAAPIRPSACRPTSDARSGHPAARPDVDPVGAPRGRGGVEVGRARRRATPRRATTCHPSSGSRAGRRRKSQRPGARRRPTRLPLAETRACRQETQVRPIRRVPGTVNQPAVRTDPEEVDPTGPPRDRGDVWSPSSSVERYQCLVVAVRRDACAVGSAARRSRGERTPRAPSVRRRRIQFGDSRLRRRGGGGHARALPRRALVGEIHGASG